jgi:16S rRNA (cytosine967-C5)-methyltransferase
MRADNVGVLTADAATFEDARGFDRVLLDPPCSGLGTLRSHPDLRWRVSPAQIERLAVEQDALLAGRARSCARTARA